MNKFHAIIPAICLFASVPASAAVDAAAAAPPSTDAATTAPATQPAAVDAASLALAHQILTLAFPPENRSQIYASLMDSIVEQTHKALETQGQNGDKGFQAIVDRSTQRMFDQMMATINAAIPDYFESMAHAYAREFSPGDLKAILAFVQTPAGQRFFERSPLILKDPDVQAASQRMLAKLTAKLPEMNRETMQDVKDYVAKKEKEQKAAAPAPVS